MNANLQTFLEYALTHNLVFALLVGALVPIACAYRVKESFGAGLKHALIVSFAGIVGLTAISVLPEPSAAWGPVAIFAVSLAAVAVLGRWGAVQGEWAGIPMQLVALAPVAGVQTILWQRGVVGLDIVLASFGAGLGFLIAIVAVAAITEQIRLAEAPSYAKESGTVWFAIAVFALGFAGFQFL